MAYVQKDNSGSLFKNDKKETDNHPNGKGSALIDGVEYWVSAWTKVAKDGVKYQSLSFQKKDDKPQSKPRPKPQSKSDAFDDDIPY